MDGEVLMIGKVVGWFGGVPKCLPSVELRTLSVGSGGLFFSNYFREGFWIDFFNFRRILGGFGRPKRSKSRDPGYFWECCFQSLIFWIISLDLAENR